MKKLLHGLLSVSIALGHIIHADPISEIEKIGRHFIPTGSSSTQDQKKIFTSNVESKQAMLTTYQAEKKSLEEENKTNAQAITTELEEALSKIRVAEEVLKKDPDNEFLKRKKTKLSETYYILKEYQQAAEQKRHLIDQIIKDLTHYLNDPEHKKFTGQFHEKKKSFEELQNIYQKITEEEKSLESLNDQEKNAISELDNRKRAASADDALYQQHTEQREGERQVPEGMTPTEGDELLMSLNLKK